MFMIIFLAVTMIPHIFLGLNIKISWNESYLQMNMALYPTN